MNFVRTRCQYPYWEVICRPQTIATLAVASDPRSALLATLFYQRWPAVPFSTTISQDFVTNRTEVTTTQDNDEFLINRPGTGLRKITKTKEILSLNYAC